MKELQRALRVLGNPRRFTILRLLHQRGEVSVGSVADAIGISMTATSKHLIVMANADLLEKRQESLVVFYRIASTTSPALKKLIALVTAAS